ncbi:MAG: efflux RND transporter permease subunit, partial [Aeromonas sp.]
MLTDAERFQLAAQSASEVIRPSLFGLVIIALVYLPILTLTGVEGKMFVPMAWVVIIALAAATLLTLFFVPAAVAIWVSGKIPRQDNRINAGLKRAYEPILQFFLQKPWASISLALLAIATAVICGRQLGSEFMPNLDEGDIAMHALRIPGTSLTQAVQMQTLLEARIKQFPEVHHVFAKIGTADVATDPMPPSVADTFIILKSRTQWPNPRKPQAQLVDEIAAAVAQIPGNNYEFTQPIQMRFNELISGVRTDVAVKLFGDDLEVLQTHGQHVEQLLGGIAGARSAKLEALTGLPMLVIKPKRAALARFGLSQAQLQATVSAALAGAELGKLYQGDRRLTIVMRLDEQARNSLEIIRQLPIALPG